MSDADEMQRLRLPRGVTYIEHDRIGMAVGGRVIYHQANGIFVDCIKCGRRSRLAGERTQTMSDEWAQVWFERHGWTVRPTLCPDHDRPVTP